MMSRKVRYSFSDFERSLSTRRTTQGDFVVLSANPLARPPAELASIRVVETWVGGERVHTSR